jgi:hypothetical protein
MEVPHNLSKVLDVYTTAEAHTNRGGEEKGLVARGERVDSRPYWPLRGEVETRSCLLEDLRHRAFAGSCRDLAFRVLETEAASTVGRVP